ncbi:hypothetical protein SynA1825c_01393 [Synechococcus sp. A18-25c]|nr:hypothetical protein SynA1560_01411 [Synechococcus sp. A15-60]QNJ19699.1 hypothetical protein SynA1825c_01393 [Synechococcus sp. A18-25c]
MGLSIEIKEEDASVSMPAISSCEAVISHFAGLDPCSTLPSFVGDEVCSCLLFWLDRR